MQPLSIALAAALALSGFQGAPSRNSVVLDNCEVRPIYDIDVPADLPAQEAGVLTKLRLLETPYLDANGRPVLDDKGQPDYPEVREGMHVTQGQLLGQIDDRLARKQEEVARYRLQVAEEEAGNDVSIRYAQKTADVAKYTVKASYEVNDKAPKTIPLIELARQELQYEQAVLQIEQATHEFGIAQVSISVQRAQLDAAELDVRRREIRAPLNGVIEEIYPSEGEWLRPGDPILRIVYMDRLRVEGRLKYDERVSPAKVDGQPVDVMVRLPGESVDTKFTGHIVFASLRMEASGQFKVRAEVDNEKDATGHWRLLPGLKATMEIYLK